MRELILLTTMDSTFASKNKKMLKDIGYKSLLARSSEESISLLEMNDEIKLAIIDIDTVEDVLSLVNHIKSKIFIPVIYTTVDKKIPINLYNDFYHSCLPKDSNEFLLENLLEAALKLFSGIRDCRIKCSLNKNNENLERREQYRAIFENDQVVMMIINPETKKIVDVNFAATRFYGWSREEMTKMSLSDISLINEDLLEKKFNLVKSQKKNYFTVKNRIRNGDVIDIEVYSGPIKIEGKNLVFEIIKNVTHRKEFENMIKKLAYYDVLTDLPNRKSFSAHLTESIKKSELNNSKIVLINLDIDYFKDVNDSFGQHVGDSLLVEVARRLEKSIRESNQVYRKGGDEFAIIINETLNQNEVSKICDRLLSQLKKPVNIEGHQIFVTGSIGVSIYPEDGTDSETLLKNSDLAMYKSKEKGKNTYHFFSEKIDLEKNLREK
ncbi:diguanylate cyclase with PAS/PAC sensor [Ilyobacter polytropus DSM 2926]|uniref:Diguanylate cyclase with PAS/PAC sensor n=1 Tax=Ilyobacter polytropus (strain ATCC 51220 / DSM 2926 / LMG 16218 / CuHBu1) TaxID=572544 RepID=E3H793_ILYPC|nr:diguanylate cyclase with PAS/PAC sensor [Ilyobacter polytropus DSM 2926]